jgi:hypothetical protein
MMKEDSSSTPNGKERHHWRFFRSGGFDQVRLETGADLMALDQLDQKLWAALSCPTKGLEFNDRTLELLDSDGDGHIHVPEVIAAVQWAGSILKHPDDLMKGAADLPLAAIDDATAEGKNILNSAREILSTLGKTEAAAINVDDTADTAAIFAQTRFNGDGIVPADATDDAAVQKVITDIIDCLGAETDRSGKPGVTKEKLDLFFETARAYEAWCREAEGDEGATPLGDASPETAAAFMAVKEKMDDYFTRCRLAKYDPRALKALNREESEYVAIAAKDLTQAATEVMGFPLAQIGVDQPLPLAGAVNPAWSVAMAIFATAVVRPLLGERQTLTEAEWLEIRERFTAYDAWLSRKAGAAVEKLGRDRIQEILNGPSQAAITALIEADRSLEVEFAHIASVDRLVRYHRDLRRLLDNFVSFREFYTGGRDAVFQAGTLYLDGRSCDLCVRVQDVGKHAELATLSKIYLAYCDCVRRGGTEKMTIAAAFTGGDSDFLMVGRNGVFYDRKGGDWDATIVRLIEHPISIRQAFWMPYKKLGKMINEQITKIASAREKARAEKQALTVAMATQKAASGAPIAPPPQPFDVAKFAGIFAAIGLAVGAIGTALAAIITGFLKLFWWQMLLAIAALILIVSGPSVILAWLKLRQRMIGPLLDANGWAINGRLKINVPFGGSLTKVAALPEGASRSMDDPFAEKKSPWPKIIIIIAVLALAFYLLYRMGLIDRWLGMLCWT